MRASSKTMEAIHSRLLLQYLDIIERRRLEKELYREREFLDILMETTPDAIYFKNNQSRFTKVNRAHAERMDLKDPVEEIVKTDFDFYSKEFAKEAFKDEQEIIRMRKIMGIVGISRDITEMKRMEDMLKARLVL